MIAKKKSWCCLLDKKAPAVRGLVVVWGVAAIFMIAISALFVSAGGRFDSLPVNVIPQVLRDTLR